MAKIGIVHQQQKDLSRLLQALKSCTAAKDLSRGKAVHAAAIHSGDDSNIYVANTLVAMYAKCGCLADAKAVFDGISAPTIASWNSLMLGYVESGHGKLALGVFSRIPSPRNARSFATAVRACGDLAGADEEKLEKILELQWRAKNAGLDSDVFVATSLVDALASCGRLGDARRAFERSSKRDVVLWTALLLGCVENGEDELALEFFSAMVAEGCKPNARTFVAAVKAYSGLADREAGLLVDRKLVKVESLERGVLLQLQAAKSGFDDDLFLASSFVDLFARCGSMIDARRRFDAMAIKDEVAWNVMMLGYAENGQEEAALAMFLEMSHPNSRSFVVLFKALSGLAARETEKKIWLETGMAFHSRAAKARFHTDLFVASSLIDLYSSCGSMIDARRVFDGMELRDSIAWNTLLLGYLENNEELLVLELFSQIEQHHIHNPALFVTAMKACAMHAVREPVTQIAGSAPVKLGCLEKAMAIHSRASRSGLDCSSLHISSAIADMYAVCGSCDDALEAFQRSQHRDVVSWSTLIDCFADNGRSSDALDLFFSMAAAGPPANSRTFIAALKACASAVDSTTGAAIHAQACRIGIEGDPLLATSLVDFWSKAGAMDRAQGVFDSADKRDVVTWTALLSGYSRQGDTNNVFSLFRGLLDERLRPNSVTYVAVLTACSHAGLVERGLGFFEGMGRVHGITAEVEHYVCMVDMLGRANKLEEALALVRKMPYEANEVVWTAVLGACKKWGNVEVGRAAFQGFVDAGGGDAAGYSLMSNLCKVPVGKRIISDKDIVN